MKRIDIKGEKITDKALNYNIISAVIGVILCLASLTAATWAWFGDSVSSIENDLSTGVYSVSVSVTDSAGNVLKAKNDTEGKEFYELSANEKYSVTLKGEGTVSEGYCILKCGNESLYTQQIYTENTQDSPNQITFSLTSASDGSLYISSCWGLYSETPQLTDGCDHLLSVNSVAIAEE